MKKAKIMLVAIAVLATVGGALAFKVNKANFSVTYCTRAIASGEGTCEGEIVNSKFGANTGVDFYYITKTGTNCNVQCDVSTDFIGDGGL